ncbi:MAG: DMT family transporter [Deltaproteobacteria bacterium]|jgi:drug/metabolite transporter (DMT)-like permease|nr:DMT family transporter [Deltaproteobacteria bacterium]
MTNLKSFHPYALTTIVFWSLAYVFTRITLGWFTPQTLGLLRYFVAAVVLLGLAAVLKIGPPAKKDLKWFLLAGLSGFTLYVLAFNKGTTTVPAATGSVVIATTPVMTAVLARLIFKETIARLQYPAIAVEFSGVAVLTLGGGEFAVNEGVVWLLVSSFLLSLYNLLQRRLTREYSALRTTIYSIVLGELFLFVLIPQALGEIQAAPPVQFAYIAALGVFSSAVAYATWSKAISLAPRTSSVSNYMFLTPLLTTALGFYIINETPDARSVAGGVLILGGMLLFNKAAAKKTRGAS